MQTEFKTKRETLLGIYEAYLKDNNVSYAVIGDTVTINLDTNRRININLKYMHTVDHYDAVVFTLKDKRTGEIDQNIVPFFEVFQLPYEKKQQNKLPKYIWFHSQKYEWYGTPTQDDIVALNNELNQYIHTWE